MASIGNALPVLSTETISLYYARDVLLENLPFIVIYGPSTIKNSTQNSSWVQAHIFSLAGLHSFPRLTVAPTSPQYAAVHHLPTDKQGDEIYRGLAASLLLYFAAIPKVMQDCLRELVAGRRHNRQAPAMFDEMHAGDLAASMIPVEKQSETLDYLRSALTPSRISWIDVDVMLPPKTIERAVSGEGAAQTTSVGQEGLPLCHYGPYDTLMSFFGVPTFLPTSKLKRAPSRPTAHSKKRLLDRDQKVSLRREILELMDTEKNYIEKLHDLVHSTANEFRQASDGLATDRLIAKLFPDSLNGILEVNSGFSGDLEKIIEDTEEEAIKDINDTPQPGLALENAVSQGRIRDSVGVTNIAKTVLQWLPKFASPYQQYMQACSDLSAILTEAIQSGQSISSSVQAYGEQHLRSMLIEPVQRLPRYSLFLDNMINLLPSSHPALNSLLKAKDHVMEICALDVDGATESRRTVTRLRNLVERWPASLTLAGRFIHALDVCEVNPPYSEHSICQPSMMLLFSSHLVVVSKADDSSLSARGLMAELERPATTIHGLAHDRPRALVYATHFTLTDLRMTESEDGRLVCVHMSSDLSVPTATPQQQAFASMGVSKSYLLQTPYEGKAPRLAEEISRARVEGRFAEALRESGRWALRTIIPSANVLGLLAAVFEGEMGINDPGEYRQSRVRLEVGGTRTTKCLLADNPKAEVVGCIAALDNNQYRLDCRTVGDVTSTDTNTSEELAAILPKRLQHMLCIVHRAQTHGLASASIALHRQILQAMPIQGKDSEDRVRSFRPISPVKLLSNFLSGTPTGQLSSPSRQREPALVGKGAPRISPPTTRETGMTLENGAWPESGVSTIQTKLVGSKDTLTLLEETLMSYVIALRSRAGNIVGRVLSGRNAADELAVNELYNALVEDPSKIQEAAEVPVDVLFVSFEKFVKVAWKDRVGPVLPRILLVNMQAGLDTGRPMEFMQHFRSALEEMTPQSQRAFSTIVRLLSDLLEASGNDGDRGTLMASFSEMLFGDDRPHHYMTLLDRLVDDYDALFEFNVPTSEEVASSTASDSLKRNRSVNTGSLSSNASSLRRKFGFGTLSRENSKSESESKVASVWRTLSKSGRSPNEGNSQAGYLSKGSLLRSRSTDTDPRMLPPLRPTSRDKPTTPSSTTSDEAHSRPGSSHRSMAKLSTIGEVSPAKPTILVKKKRRSSLSDLKPLTNSPSLSTWVSSSPSQLRTPTKYQYTGSSVKHSPRDQHAAPESSFVKPNPSYTLIGNRSGSPERITSSQAKGAPPQGFGSPQQKSASPEASRLVSQNKTANRTDKSINASSSPVKCKTYQSAIPASQALSERQWPPNATILPQKAAQTPQKLRLQSPQKIRQRLSNEQKDPTTTSSELQAELAAIGNEISALKRTPIKTSNIAPIKPLNVSPKKVQTTSPAKPSTPPSFEDLSSRLDQLTKTLATHVSSTASYIDSLTAENTSLSSQLRVSNRKVQELDSLYQEASAENELLYERFNQNLDKLLARIKKGAGVQVLRDTVGGLEKEVAALREEKRVMRRQAIDRDEG